MRVSHEAVNHVARVQVKSGHCPVRSNAIDDWTLSRSRTRAWNIELYEPPMGIAHKHMIHVCPVNTPSRNSSNGTHSKRKHALVGSRARARRVVGSEIPMLIQ